MSLGVSTATLCALGCGHRMSSIDMDVGGGVTPARHAFEQREADDASLLWPYLLAQSTRVV